MLLTLKQPVSNFKGFRDYSPPTPPSTTSRYSPALTSASAGPAPAYPQQQPPTAQLVDSKRATEVPMSTPHRALPPPAGMPLQSTRESQLREQTSYSQPISQIQEAPRPQVQQQPIPQQTQQQNDDRYWVARTEEHKRVQEEEKTKQETLRLEQRRIENDMLRTSLSGGIPPHLIPMVFAGMGGGKLANASLEWTQQYIAQAQQAQQQQQQLQIQSSTRPPSPTSRIREERLSQSHSFTHQHPMPAPLPSTPLTVTGSNTSPNIFVPGYNLSPASRARQLPGPSSLSRSHQNVQLPRLNTNEMQIIPPPSAPVTQMQMSLQGQDRPLHSHPEPSHEDQSPQLYFHHWQPPSTASQSQSTLPSQGGSQSQQSTQAGTLRKNSSSKHLLTDAAEDTNTNSPRKRKATGQHQAVPAPTGSQFNSPPFSHAGSSASGPSVTPRRTNRDRAASRSDRGSLDFLPNSSRRQKRNDSDPKSHSVGVSPEMQGYGQQQHETGPISGRRSTLSGPDLNEREQRGMYQSHQSTLREERPHYELRNSYMGGQSQDLRRELGRSEEHDREMERERERDREREMVPHHQILKRDDRA